MGQRANFTLMPGVMASLDQLHDWGIKNIENTLYENNKIINEILKKLKQLKLIRNFISLCF